MGEAANVTGPDLSTEGYPAADLGVGDMVLGHIEDTPVVLARSHDGVFAIGARCTHYGASLGAGKLDDNLVFCPLHHSAFDIRSGRAVRAPALNPVPQFSAVERDGTIYVAGPVDRSDEKPDPGGPSSIVVVGAGAAGAVAVEMLRNEGYRGPITMFGAEDDVPIDRPNLSKDYLAGSAPEEWMPLRSEGFYADNDIDLRLGTRVTAIDRDRSVVATEEGSEHAYGALLLATGADPITIPIPGAETNRVFTLRTLADSRAIIEALDGSSSAAVIGASFIGLEVAASLRERGIAVHVVAPETVLMEPVLGGDVGRFIQALHESHGVVFHLGHVAGEITPEGVTLDDGSKVAADLIVMGVGVRPAVALAETAGLDTDNGVVVDEQLRTSDPAIFAAGDIARYPDRRLGRPTRIEHWALAERHGQVAALNMLGRGVAFRDAPFFWSQHYDVRINYVGHAESWDSAEIRGSVADGDALIAYREGGKVAAVATIGRDRASLDARVALESDDEETLDSLA